MKTLVKKLKKLLNKEIEDLIVFGSFVKDKPKVNDIDIAVIVKEHINKILLREKIQQLTDKKIHLQEITIKDYYKFIWITLIKEGYSIKYNKYLHQIYNIKPVILYKYSLKELTISKKVMFERAIKNFKNIEKLSNRVVLVPIKISGDFSSFLKNWNIDYDSVEYGLLPLVR